MPHHLIVAAAAHTWSDDWTRAATGFASIVFFWLGMLNITLLAALFSAAATRRDRRAAARETSPPSPPTGRPADHTTARLLLSDAERDEATDVVCRAIGDGRLGIEEGVARIDKVLAARRKATLIPVLADLPVETTPTPSDRLGPTAGLLALRVAASALVAAAAVLEALTGIWALWPVAVAALVPCAFWPVGASRGSALARATRRRGPHGAHGNWVP